MDASDLIEVEAIKKLKGRYGKQAAFWLNVRVIA
jgi:hypothetical protein